MKGIQIIILFLLISNANFAQDKTKKDSTQFDTTQYKKIIKKAKVNNRTIQLMNKSTKPQYKIAPQKLYRPTRLGSSSPRTDTYKKNDFGAGSVTTNPNKSGKSFIYASSEKEADSLNLKPKDSVPTWHRKDSIPTKND